MQNRTLPTQWRYIWKDRVYSPALNKLINNASEAIVLHHIADMIHKGEVACFPTQKQLVEKTGLPHATLNRALTRLCRIELIGRHSGTGGRHTTYWLPLPAHFLNQLPDEILKAYREYLGAVSERTGIDISVSTLGLCVSQPWDTASPNHETLRVSPGDTHSKLLNELPNELPNETTVSEVEPLERAPAEALPITIEKKEEVEEVAPRHEPQLPLPIAGFDAMQLWVNYLPNDENESVGRADEVDTAWESVFRAMQNLAGFRIGMSAVMGDMMTAYFKAKTRFREQVEDGIPERVRTRMAMLMVEGRLTKGHVVNVLAHAGVEPLNLGTLEVQNVKAS